jgi:hypothetical protein
VPLHVVLLGFDEGVGLEWEPTCTRGPGGADPAIVVQTLDTEWLVEIEIAVA